MALSEINIKDEVLNHTNTVINNSNYRILRRHLLERKPIINVTNSIDALLAEHYSSDKQEMINHYTQIACQSQLDSDMQERSHDEQEFNSDNAIKSNYAVELPILENKLVILDQQCHYQQRSLNIVNEQLDELKRNMTQANQSIQRIQQERRSLNSRYGYIAPQGQELQNPNPVVIYSIDDQLTWNRLFHEETRLVAETQRLTYQIDSKQRESSREKDNFNQSLSEKKHTEKRYQNIKSELDVELPNKEQKRHIRHQERTAREYARRTNDPHLQQLAHANLEALKLQIANHDHDLEGQRNEIKNEAAQMSYPVYMEQLKQALAQNGELRISYSEQESLKTILSMVTVYVDMEKQEQTIVKSLNEEKNNVVLYQQNLKDSKAELKSYIESEPKLTKENKDLKKANSELQAYIGVAEKHRTNALYAALFGVSGSLLATSLITPLVISPLFLIVPGALATVAFISLIVAVVYHFQKANSQEEIVENQKTVRSNEITILHQLELANDLTLTIIPELKTNIKQSEQNIVDITQQLEAHQEVMQQQLFEIENINGSTNSISNWFFGRRNDNVVNLRQPAVQEQVETDGQETHRNLGNWFQ